MEYNLINPNYKYDTLAQALRGRQQEHFHYNFDKTNFEQMLTTLEPGEQRDRIQHLLNSTIVEMNKVEAIYNALMTQVDDETKLAEAIARLDAQSQVE